MPRKHTPDQPADESQTPTTAAATLPPVPNTPEQTPTNTEPPLPANAEPSPSFVERLQQQRRGPVSQQAFGIAGDYEAGVRLFENRQARLMALKFEAKPSEAVLDTLKDAGYRWNPRDKVWVHPITPESARTTRIDAERLYQEVRARIRQEKGIESGQEIPF